MPALQQNGFKLDRQQLLNKRDILVDQLLLERDRVGRDDRLALGAHGIKSGWYQIGERLSNPGASFNDEVLGRLESARHIAGHLLLLGAILVVGRA